MGENERQRVASAYGRYARSARKQQAWDPTNVGNIAVRQEFIRATERMAGDDLLRGEILDVGCGTGWWLASLAQRGASPRQLFGIDVLPQRLEAARSQLPGATLAEADARSLPFEHGRFQTVTLLLMLSSLRDRRAVEQALHEARRVTRPGGTILVWEPRLPNPANSATTHIPRSLVAGVLGEPTSEMTLVVFPPLARRVRTVAAYERLARLAPLRSHRLMMHRRVS